MQKEEIFILYRSHGRYSEFMKDIGINKKHQGIIQETIKGIVDRVTFHNPDNGWSILRVTPFSNPHQQDTVIVHQIKVFAGATMEFKGSWTVHPKYGRQFIATDAEEKKPASTAALEKYLGSGLIKGVGPKTAKKIVHYFKDKTLDIFENDINRLVEVPGIAQKKLEMISSAWIEHRAIRNVMMFLQSHGISTLFAVKIYKEYGDNAIEFVRENPYRLAVDFFGIGFFSADKIALSIGLAPDSPKRIMAAVNHVLAASRNFGHCYLTFSQINDQVEQLLNLKVEKNLSELIESMEKQGLIMERRLVNSAGTAEQCYYSRTLYFDELYVAKKILGMGAPPEVDGKRVEKWLERYSKSSGISLSKEQEWAVKNIVCAKFSILTGGPGCGKTTAIRVLVKLLEAMKLKIMLTAPTGRASQRMTDVIGRKAKTIHRLLKWQGGKFKKNEENPLELDFLIVDECSMLDINITASLLKAVPVNCQVLFTGDPDQLPSVGAGDVLKDLMASGVIPCFTLTKIFRQAEESMIIRYAHEINSGKLPWIPSPFKNPELWRNRNDCIFIDSDEATKEEISFIRKIKALYNSHGLPDRSCPDLSAAKHETDALSCKKLHINTNSSDSENKLSTGTVPFVKTEPYEFETDKKLIPYEKEINIPKKFLHVNIENLVKAGTRVEELMAVVKKVHPWSSLHYGYSASDCVKKLYLDWIPKYYGKQSEIQILSPMTRGSLGTINLNKIIQEASNPYIEGRAQLKVGEKLFRTGDRVIHKRNNYDLGVFNGDIGVIEQINNLDFTCVVSFFPDNRKVQYKREDIMELDLAYAVTIHKSQGSEFEIVIIPVLTQHFKMLFRNLIYTGITRAKKLAVFTGTRKALAMAVKNQDVTQRQTALKFLLQSKK